MYKKKRIMLGLLYVVLITGLLFTAPVQASEITLQGEIVQGRFLVPMRGIFEALGAEVGWDGETRTVTGVKGDISVKLVIDSTEALVNRETIELDVPATIIDGSTFVPTRFVSESLGADVSWDGDTRVATITQEDVIIKVHEMPEEPVPDGSDIWQFQDAGIPTGESLFDVHFVDAQAGWAVGSSGLVCRTTDGGQTWSIVDTPAHRNLNAVYFSDSQQGWIAGHAAYYTNDGGNSWTNPPGCPDQRGFQARYQGIDFIDDSRDGSNEKIGWLAYYSISSGSTRYFGSLVQISMDGSWTSVISTKHHRQFLDVSVVDEERVAISYFERSVLRDKAIVQILQGTDVVFQQNLIFGETGQFITSVDFVDDQYGWAVGSGGNIHYTSNGGRYWYKQDSPTNVRLNDVVFVDRNRGWAVGDSGVILSTTDGGKTWSIQESGTKSDLYSLSFIDKDHGWAVGSGGIILQYVKK